MKLNMRINYTLSRGLDIFLFVTVYNHRRASLAFAILERGETIRAIVGRVHEIEEKMKDSVRGRVRDSKIERQSA